MDIIADLDFTLPPDIFKRYGGVGATLDPSKPYVVVLQHPVTTEYGQGLAQINETLEAVMSFDTQIVWLWPNIDAGSDDVSKGLRMYREKHHPENLHFFINFSVEDYARLINNSQCLIGNSSSALREGAYMGIPAVNIGTRQHGREHGPNVKHAGYDREEIRTAIETQLAHGRYEPNKMFGDGTAGQQISDILATADITIQKTLNY